MSMPQLMQAAMYYGPKDIRIEQLPVPDVGPNDILIKVRAATTCGTDVKSYFRGHPNLTPPSPFGHEAAGDIVLTGEKVARFRQGSRVAVSNTGPCGECYYCKRAQPNLCEFQRTHLLNGSFAEYLLVPENIWRQNMFLIPEKVSYSAAALVEPLSCALFGIEESRIRIGDTVAILGAGPIGLFMVQLAKMQGAYVIVCEISQKRLALATRAGADQVVGARERDEQVRSVRKLTPDERGADVVIDATGIPEVWETGIEMVRKGGLFNAFGGAPKGTNITVDTYLLHYCHLTLKGVYNTTPRHAEVSLDLIARGQINVDLIISAEWPMPRLVEALEKQKVGEVVKVAIRPDL
jgi:L-iditol 2-dehydrogenase